MTNKLKLVRVHESYLKHYKELKPETANLTNTAITNMMLKELLEILVADDTDYITEAKRVADENAVS